MVVVALRGPRIRAPPNVIATLIRRHFNGLWGLPVVGTPNATHEGIGSFFQGRLHPISATAVGRTLLRVMCTVEWHDIL
jgi:hypothetical protein